MSDRLMTPADLERVTGCITKKAQLYTLISNKIPVVESSTGEPIVMRSAYELVAKETPILTLVIPTVEDALAPKKLEIIIPAVYFLWAGKTVVYVGKSTNIFARIGSHHKSDKEWDSFTHVHVSAKLLDIVEMEFIARLQPRYNKTGVKKYVDRHKEASWESRQTSA